MNNAEIHNTIVTALTTDAAAIKAILSNAYVTSLLPIATRNVELGEHGHVLISLLFTEDGVRGDGQFVEITCDEDKKMLAEARKQALEDNDDLMATIHVCEAWSVSSTDSDSEELARDMEALATGKMKVADSKFRTDVLMFNFSARAGVKGFAQCNIKVSEDGKRSLEPADIVWLDELSKGSYVTGIMVE